MLSPVLSIDGRLRLVRWHHWYSDCMRRFWSEDEAYDPAQVAPRQRPHTGTHLCRGDWVCRGWLILPVANGLPSRVNVQDVMEAFCVGASVREPGLRCRSEVVC
jgi:hypothetical protein